MTEPQRTSRRRTAFRLALGLLAIIGMGWAVLQSMEVRKLESEYERLSLAVGHLPIPDAKKIYIAAIPSKEKFVWRFRVYLPAQYEGREVHCSGKISATTPNQKAASKGWASHGPTNEPIEFIATIAFFKEQNQWQMHTNTYNSRSFTGIDQQLGNVFDNPEKIIVELVGASGPAAFSSNETVCLLRIRSAEAVEDKDTADPLYYGTYMYLVPKSAYAEFEAAQQ